MGCPEWLPVLIFSVLTIASASLQAVAFKLTGYSLGPFPYFILLCVSFAFVPIFFSGVWCIEAFAKIDDRARTWNYKKAFALIGCLNGLNGVLIIYSVPKVSGVAQSCLSQAVIPLTFGLSVLILRSTFSKSMLFGAFVILCGVGIELSPTFVSTNRFSGTESSSWWSVMFAIGQLPAALCSVYQEKAFSQGVRINVVYMMAWSSLAQFCSLCLAAPLDFVPGFGNSNSIAGFSQSFQNASLCLANNWPSHSECSSAAILLVSCIVTMLLTNIFQALLVKHSSASLSVLVLTLITPASTFCFTLPALMGKTHTESMSTQQGAALAVLMAGVIIYRYADMNQLKIDSNNFVDGEDSMVSTEKGSAQDYGAANRIRGDCSSTRGSRSISVGSALSSSHSNTSRRQIPRPLVMSSRSGIINCEYTGGANISRTSVTKITSILFEGTESEGNLSRTHQSAPLLSRSMPQSVHLVNDKESMPRSDRYSAYSTSLANKQSFTRL